jgi:hypothetical protein
MPAPDREFTAPRPFRPEPAIDAFPTGLWTQIAGRRHRLATRALLADADPRGYRRLREAECFSTLTTLCAWKMRVIRS